MTKLFRIWTNMFRKFFCNNITPSPATLSNQIDHSLTQGDQQILFTSNRKINKPAIPLRLFTSDVTGLWGKGGGQKVISSEIGGRGGAQKWVTGFRLFKNTNFSTSIIFLKYQWHHLNPPPLFLADIGVRSNIGLYGKYFKNAISH